MLQSSSKDAAPTEWKEGLAINAEACYIRINVTGSTQGWAAIHEVGLVE